MLRHFASLQALEIISLQRGHLVHFSGGINAFCQAIGSLTRLTSLELSSMRYAHTSLVQLHC